MSLNSVAEEYFSTMNPIATKIHEDIVETRNTFEHIWNTLSEKEKSEIINESIIKPDIALKYALLDSLDFDLNDPPVHKDDLMSFFGRDHAQKVVQDENGSYRDEYSAPFLYQTKSQLNLCIESRKSKDVPPSPPVMSELAISHSKVVNELKNALKNHEVSRYKDSNREIVSPTSFITKFIGNFKGKDEEKECLVENNQTQIVDFRNYKSQDNYRGSIAKSNGDLSEENRGLLSSQASSNTDFHSTETLTDSTVPKTGFDFLDNW
ncbi:uncharacterized protein C1orf198 homolog [Pieris brassicae]|uniref:DUF4706 domain-containing protein n=1 Tax=Pieris brassicae TaxID=7116 RepID=A0A9P0TR93_PIEBR|nr:uncharacterized protein C1orf198 homolog [Pieris brassicae]CAH4036329.1 unnamed protein product [Pieris brassicae]